MDDFLIYLRLGFTHIIDWGGTDHILFILALALRYTWKDGKQLLILVTAFTIGHSITLALSTMDWIRISPTVIELLIPITILLTAFVNFGVKSFRFESKYPLIYFFALFFGLIHGMGFSYYLKSLLGKEDFIFGPLLAFNLGLELGQLLVVILILIISFIFVDLFKVDRKRYLQIGSGIAAALALNMVMDRILYLF
mgnify:CR=1 FL=1|jgi:hydrogenase/urease accessory protein HupE